MSTELKAVKRKPDANKSKLICKEDETEEIPLKYGPVPRLAYQRVWARGVMILGVLAVVYYSTKRGREVTMAKQKEILNQRSQDVVCSEVFRAEINRFPGCVPERCGRLVSDKLISSSEANTLLNLAERGFALGGSSGGASILDLHSGALSQGESFVNMYKLDQAKNLFHKSDFTMYKVVKTKIQHAVAHHFGVDVGALHLTHPTFFSRLTNLPATTVHDEYWHPHVDKDTYESFHYTSLLYLADYGKDFEGGRFVFIDRDGANRTVEPRKGRVSMFTSGSENIHFVEKVKSGVRYAVTVSFTCDPKFKIDDPALQIGTE